MDQRVVGSVITFADELISLLDQPVSIGKSSARRIVVPLLLRRWLSKLLLLHVELSLVVELLLKVRMCAFQGLHVSKQLAACLFIDLQLLAEVQDLFFHLSVVDLILLLHLIGLFELMGKLFDLQQSSIEFGFEDVEWRFIVLFSEFLCLYFQPGVLRSHLGQLHFNLCLLLDN